MADEKKAQVQEEEAAEEHPLTEAELEQVTGGRGAEREYTGTDVSWGTHYGEVPSAPLSPSRPPSH